MGTLSEPKVTMKGRLDTPLFCRYTLKPLREESTMKKHIMHTALLGAAALTASLACSAPNATEQLFKKRCAMCHKLPVPESFSQKAWDDQVDRMAKRAGISPEQVTQIKSLRK